MELEQARQFLTDHHRAVLVTRRKAGGLQMSPVAAGLDGEGRIIISSRERAYKVRNLRRDPRAALCVLSEGFIGDWIQVDGTTEVVSLPEAMELLVEYYRAVAGEHPDWDEYRQAMADQHRVLVRITIERAGPDRAA